MVSVNYGELLNINEEIWPRIFAQANFTCIENNILMEDLPFAALLTCLARKSISCDLISIPKSDPLFRKENILQILRKKNAEIQDILENYSLDQIMQIFDQWHQFEDCFWINEVKLILKNFCWMKFGFRISNSLSLSIPAHSSFPSPFIR